MACHHSPWMANTVRRRQALHAITAFGQHTRSNDVGRGMTSSPLDSTYARTTSGVACHHRLWAAHLVERCRAWHAIIALVGKHVGRRRAWHAIIALGQHSRSDDVGRGMPSPPLDNTHGRTTSGMACHHHRRTVHTVGRRRVWHDINALGLHAQSDDVRRGITSPPFDSTHGRTTSGVA